MSSNQYEETNISNPPAHALPSCADAVFEQQGDLTVSPQALNLDSGNSVASAQCEDIASQPNHSEEDDAELLVRSPNALRLEAQTLIAINNTIGDRNDQLKVVHRTVNARLIAIEARLKQLGPGDNTDIPLMNENALQAEKLRLMCIVDGGDDGQGLSGEDADAINHRSNEINLRLQQFRLSSLGNNHESLADISLMSLNELDGELDRLVAEWESKNADPSHKGLHRIRRRFQEVTKRQAQIIHFPADNNSEIFGEANIQKIMLGGGSLPRFLFRGSNARSGGNDSESEPASSDDGSSNKSQIVRMINAEDRIVPHAHFADPTMLNHPRRQTFDSLRDASDYHTSARRFNTPFTSWTCDLETALYFAIGHFPNEGEPEALEAAGLRNDWVFHEADEPSMLTVIDTWTLPDRHLRIFHQPALATSIDPETPGIPSEFLIYGALDRADGVDLRGISIQELRARLGCPTWPHCLSRDPVPHQPKLQDVSEAWTIAHAFIQYLEEETDGEEVEENNIDLGLSVLAGELARQQWAGFPPRPDSHLVDEKVQIQWPEAWVRHIRRCLERISPGPLGARMSGIPLANAGTPYVGFPQFRLMQQLLLSWVMDYPSGLIGDNDPGNEERDVLGPPRHSCANPSLLETLTDIELVHFWSQMVKRDRHGTVPVPPPREYCSERSNSTHAAENQPAGEDIVQKDATEEEEEEGPRTNSALLGRGPPDGGTNKELSNGVARTNFEDPEQRTQQPTQRQPEARGTYGALLEAPAIPRPEFPEEQQVRLELRGGEYQEWGEEVPVTFWRVVMLIVVFLLMALYLSLVLAVY